MLGVIFLFTFCANIRTVVGYPKDSLDGYHNNDFVEQFPKLRSYAFPINKPAATEYVYCDIEPEPQWMDIPVPDGKIVRMLRPIGSGSDCPQNAPQLKCRDCGGNKRVTFPSGRQVSRCQGVRDP
jgi:hypothetical protein